MGKAELHSKLDLMGPKQVKRPLEHVQFVGIMHQETAGSMVKIVTPREIDIGQPLGELVNLASADCDANLAQQTPEVQQARQQMAL